MSTSDPQQKPETSFSEDARDDLLAAIHARGELGAEHEEALVASFLERIDREISAKVESQLPTRESKHSGHSIALGSMALGIPLSAIAGGIGSSVSGSGGLIGLAIAWAGIVAVNIAAALSERRSKSRR